MMTQDRHAIPITILICEDDADDRLRMQQALEDAHIINDLRFVEDGRRDPTIADIPMAILTTSRLDAHDADAIESQRLGVSSFITKPVTFSGLVDAMNVLGRYWLEIAESPPVP